MGPFAAEDEAKQYIRVCEAVLDEDIGLSPISEIRSSIINDQSQMNLYGEKDSKKLLSRYNTKLNHIRSVLYDEDEEMHILNALEYIKYTCSQEDYIGIPGVLFFESIDNYPYSSLLLGKGTSYSQVRLLQELLNNRSYTFTEVQRMNSAYSYEKADKFNVLLRENTYLDPYHYNGSRKKNIAYHYNSLVTEEEFDETKRKKAKEKVTSYLIELLGLKNTSKKLFNDNDHNQVKVTKIIEYIKENYRDFNLPVRHYIIEINGIRLEVSRLLELFLIANNIPYTEDEQSEKENTIFNVEETKIDIRNILTYDKNKKYIKKECH